MGKWLWEGEWGLSEEGRGMGWPGTARFGRRGGRDRKGGGGLATCQPALYCVL